MISDTNSLANQQGAGLSLKASIFGFLASTTAMTVVMILVSNLH